MVWRTLVLAALASVAVSLTGSAQVVAAPLGAYNVSVSPNQSDSNMRWAGFRLEENNDMLNNDRHDYGGYRVRAIRLFQRARQQITLGLRFDNRTSAATGIRPDSQMVSLRGLCASDINLNVVRRNVEHIMDVLQRDNSDYGGHRVAALRLLAAGREMLKDAIQYDATH